MSEFTALNMLKNGSAFNFYPKKFGLDTPEDLERVYYLREDESFGTEEFVTHNSFLTRANEDLVQMQELFDALSPDPFPASITNAYYHRSLCGFITANIWSKYKKTYCIDPDFYKDLVDTNAIDLDYNALSTLPFPCFYVDLSRVPIGKTRHYQGVEGLFVTVISNEKLHITIVDRTSDYNPVTCYSNHKKFPTYWGNLDVKGLHLVDFILDKKKSKCVLEKGKVDEGFGWTPSFGGVGDILDMKSPIAAELGMFVVNFLYFLHSKTQDIVERHYSNTKCSSKREDEIKVWDVGFYYGEKVRTLDKKERLYGGIATSLVEKSRPRAYVRKAHWHKYWCGSGEERHLELRWVEPTYCNGTVSDIVANMSIVTDEELSKSDGEKLVEMYLQKASLSFDREYVVSVKGHARRFDFCVMYRGNQYFIEFDGEQHFKSVERFGGEKGFKERQRADFEKNKYAKQHKIPLLRIRFDQKYMIPEIIDQFFESPSVHRLNPIYDNSKYYKL